MLFLLVFSCLGWQWLREAGQGLPIDDAPGDAWLIFWVLDWVHHALLTAPGSLFDPPINFPAARQLTGSEHFLSAQLFYLPVRVVTGDAMLAANLTAFVCYPLAGAAMAWLLRGLGLPLVVALVAGFVYAFGFLGQPGRLHVLQLPHFYLPLAALACLRLRQDPTWRRALVVTAVMICGVLSSYHMAVYLTVAMGVWLVVEASTLPSGDRRRFVALAGGAIGVALAVLVALSLSYLQRPEATEGSVVAVSRWATRHLDVGGRSELAAVSPGDLVRRAATCILGAGVIWYCADIDGTTAQMIVRELLPVQPYLVLLPALALLGTLSALRRGSPWRRTACVAVLLGLAGFLLGGPAAVRVGPFEVALPVRWLEWTPARFIRVPLRAWTIAFFGGTLLVALGLRGLVAVRRPWGAILAATAVVVVGAHFGRFTSNAAASKLPWWRFAPHGFLRAAAMDRDRGVYEQIAGIVQAVGPGPLLEWPWHLDHASAVVGQMLHRQPSVLFYTGYLPLHAASVERLVSLLPDPDALDDLVDMTTLRWILVRPERDWRNPRAREPALERFASLRRHRATREIGEFALIELDPTSHRPQWLAALAAGPRPGHSILGPAIELSPAVPNAIILVTECPRQAAAGRSIALDVRVHNAGTAAWTARLSGRPVLPFSVYFEIRWIDLGGSGGWAKWRGTADLRRDVLAKETVYHQLRVVVPDEPGRYRLMLRLRRDDGPESWAQYNAISRSIKVVAPPQPASARLDGPPPRYSSAGIP